MPVKAATERNFRRAGVKVARRRRFRPQVSWTVGRRALSVLLLVFGVYQSVTFAFTTPLLRVSRISVHGNVRLSSGEVQALVEDLRGTSILQVDLDASRAVANVLPKTAIGVSESGLKTSADLHAMKALGYQAFLMGERFMVEPDPGAALAGLIESPADDGFRRLVVVDEVALRIEQQHRHREVARELPHQDDLDGSLRHASFVSAGDFTT